MPRQTGRLTVGRNITLTFFEFFADSRVEAGSNTSTVALRVIGGDEKGSLEPETVKYGRESQGTRTREWLRWRGPVEIANDRPLLSSERTLHINKPATVRLIKIWS
jgi:hypothetical protein